jgi:signal transduction histidine kinase
MGRDHVVVADAAVPIMAAAVVTVGVFVRADGVASHVLHVLLLLGLASAAVLTARRRAPVATLVASGGLVLAMFAVDAAAGAAAVLAPAVALYSVGLRRGRIHQVVAGIAAVAAVVATDVFLAGRATPTPQTIAHAALVALPLLAAETLRTRRSYISLLLERLELAERTREEEAHRRVEQERLRIARDLHDVVAHTLTTINVQAGVARHLLDREPGHARTALATIEDASRDALDELRAVVGVLREHDPGRAPLSPAPSLDAVGVLVARAREAGQEVDVDVGGDVPERVSDAVGNAAFRIVQESLTNARRHAPGAPTHVRLFFEPRRLRIVVENDAARTTAAAAASASSAGAGAGAGEVGASAAGEVAAAGGADGAGAGAATDVGLAGEDGGAGGDDGGAGVGVGIIGMKERAAAVGGSVEAAPRPGGFRVVAELPFRRSVSGSGVSG